MHRLVQEAVRQRMTSESWLSTFAIVIDILAAMYPRQVLGMRMETFWAKCNLYLPQVLSVASFYDSMPSVDTSTMLPTDHSVDDRFLLLSKTLAELLHNATW